ncbi:MAG: galactokinase [Saprospiraceae bacterium]|nr:galactokinase [Saprospiraceae bacterium]
MSEVSKVESIRKKFRGVFGNDPGVVAKAPGRINIIGEHIDYNDGYVLPVAIDKYIIAAAGTNEVPGCYRLYALDLEESYEWVDGQPAATRPLWVNYIYGSICEWQHHNPDKMGIDLVFSGDIPTGAGLSSSAALEAAVALAIGKLWNVSMTQKELALHCQKVEHEYVGVKCGIMDQYASIFGGVDQAILLDCLSITHQYLPLEMGEYVFLLCDTGVTHSLAASGYNDRRASCEVVINKLKSEIAGINNWRDVTLSVLENVRDELKPAEFKRASHVVREIDRVKRSADALKNGDLAMLGNLMYQSHNDLSKNYEVSCPELDFLVDQARKESGILGARMMGGGFGGCTINLIDRKKVDEFFESTARAYQERFNLRLRSYMVHSGEGAGLI